MIDNPVRHRVYLDDTGLQDALGSALYRGLLSPFLCMDAPEPPRVAIMAIRVFLL